ncbi:syntaxin binding protein 6 (amisyn), like isoform X1 [Salmo salar]|uniref:Syntaxin binding protein 6 (Amisyn), like isoform X1 n=1 Tax=Salmo salar TaxID=8030 RepID=A0A1S3MBI6_SALSA|nr:syntaxin-binding protein 6-like isoform X1 [Salmo salar]|eukprot:XP_014000430.1 PREDICTED: syntaxin-binding protein 6-like isoform X1 [Salmo salar]
MNIQSAINREVFAPRDERMLVAVEVKRRKRKRVPFLPTGGKGEYMTYICLSVTNKKPAQLLITKVKRFGGSAPFTRRSQWAVEQLRQVNGINPNKDCPEFDLVFDNAFDQWVASSAPEKCIFIQIMYHACQTYWEGKEGVPGSPAGDQQKAPGGQSSPGAQGGQMGGPGPQARRKSTVGPRPRHTEFVNCQSKLTGDACKMNLVVYRCKVFFNRMKKVIVSNQSRSQAGAGPRAGPSGQRPPGGSMGSVVQRASQALQERGERLGRAEDKTVDLMHKAQQFADTAHKLALKHSN